MCRSFGLQGSGGSSSSGPCRPRPLFWGAHVSSQMMATMLRGSFSRWSPTCTCAAEASICRAEFRLEEQALLVLILPCRARSTQRVPTTALRTATISRANLELSRFG